MGSPVALAMLLYVVIAGRWGDQWLARAEWAVRHPLLGLRAWLTLVLSSTSALVAGLLLLSHDVLEHTLMWALHADKALLHAQYAGGARFDLAWNGAALVLLVLGGALAGSVLRQVLVARGHRTAQARGDGSSISVAGVRAVVVASHRPEAWCARGAGNQIFVTSAAVDGLPRPALSALLAHEERHLRGRHHRRVLAARLVGRFASRCGLFRAIETQVRLLVELDADDAAVRRHGRAALMQALLVVGGPTAPSGVLSAADGAVGPRIARLVDDPWVGLRRRGWLTNQTSLWAMLLSVLLPMSAVVLPGLLVLGSAH